MSEKITTSLIEQAITLSKIPCLVEILKQNRFADVECLACFYFYKRLESDLTKLYPTYNLAWRAVCTDFDTFRGYVLSRWSSEDYKIINNQTGYNYIP